MNFLRNQYINRHKLGIAERERERERGRSAYRCESRVSFSQRLCFSLYDRERPCLEVGYWGPGNGLFGLEMEIVSVIFSCFGGKSDKILILS